MVLFTYNLLLKALEEKGKPVSLDDISNQVSGDYMVVMDDIKKNLDILERKKLIEKNLEKDHYVFSVNKKLDANEILKEHPDIFEHSLE